MKILLLLLKNNLIQLCRLNQLRYADNQKRRNTIYLYIFVGTILIGGLVYLSYSLNIVFFIMDTGRNNHKSYSSSDPNLHDTQCFYQYLLGKWTTP